MTVRRGGVGVCECTPLLGYIISKSCRFSSGTWFTPLILAFIRETLILTWANLYLYSNQRTTGHVSLTWVNTGYAELIRTSLEMSVQDCAYVTIPNQLKHLQFISYTMSLKLNAYALSEFTTSWSPQTLKLADHLYFESISNCIYSPTCPFYTCTCTLNESYNLPPYFLQLVRIIKAKHQRILVLYKGWTLSKTHRVILFKKYPSCLNSRSLNTGTLDSKSHSFWLKTKRI